MKAKELLKSILLIGAVFWAFIVVAYYIGEHRGRESVESKTIAKTDTLYIQKERIYLCSR